MQRKYASVSPLMRCLLQCDGDGETNMAEIINNNDMIRYMIWYTIWYDVMWYIWYGMICYDTWYGIVWYDVIWYDMIYSLTAIGLTPGGSSTVHICAQTIHRTTHLTTEQHN